MTLKGLQTDVAKIWLVLLQLHNKWMFEYFLIIDDPLICKFYEFQLV